MSSEFDRMIVEKMTPGRMNPIEKYIAAGVLALGIGGCVVHNPDDVVPVKRESNGPILAAEEDPRQNRLFSQYESYNFAESVFDFDNDDDLDILVAGFSDFGDKSFATIYTFTNEGNGEFVRNSLVLDHIVRGTSNIRKLYPIDLDNDGYLDAIAKYDNGKEVVLYTLHNDGQGNFSLGALVSLDELASRRESDAAVIEFDTDGSGELNGEEIEAFLNAEREKQVSGDKK